ncbi:beta-L-arabinofuranosidase domain-containing protein [Glycomyces tenuis]|uniref:beta-L-arabinofuranosidase domain-containing protein n=1 Tax=Glycomyces tenuis TaxID=58116 RepID=UPI00040B1FD1|nr:beta-L-arabinofuranosidase domain-containing protein [Glycomyces tenuis]
MQSSPLSRRRLFQTAGAAAVAATAAPAIGGAAAHAVLPPARADIGVAAHQFTLGQVALTSGRWKDNQDRTLSYLRFIDVDRLLYNFRSNHRLPTNGAPTNGGWDAPDFPFRTHMQGHFLTAWAHAGAALGDTVCRDKANRMVAGLAECQANNGAAGFNTGYLSGFPEADFDGLESGSPSNGNVPYYCVHKTLAGLLDVWRYLENTQARDVLLELAGWVDWRTGRLSPGQMQDVLGREFGGMNDVLAELYQQTGEARWLTAAQRFDHAAVFDPLAAGEDRLNGLHANTQVPKAVGAAREYKATGTGRYRDIAGNFWRMVVDAHSYVIGGNSQAEHFRPPNAIAGYLDEDTCEGCNTYNMLKLTRELWAIDPGDASYFDFYERALLGHMIGWQNPDDPHGHITYFTPLNPGGRRGVGPAWGGGTWSTDYDSFWCCQGTGIETHSKLFDSIYGFDDAGLYVNLFTPSVLDWTDQGVTVTQTTDYPVGDTTTLTVSGGSGGEWTLRVRVPAWTEGATISVNGQAQDVEATPGTYASLTRSWASGDTVTVRLPMRIVAEAANDDPNVSAIVYGPVVLSGNYGDTNLGTLPELEADSVERVGSDSLAFTATANGQAVNLGPFYDAHGHNYTVYWNAPGTGGGSAAYKFYNAGSDLVLGIQDMSTADGGTALQWHDSGTADHLWELVTAGSAVKLRNRHSGKVLGVRDMSTADGAQVLQWSDNGTADHLWALVDSGDGTHQVRNGHSGKLLAVQNASTAAGAAVVQGPDDGGRDKQWRIVPDGARRIANAYNGMVLGVQDMSTADGAAVIQWSDSGTADHLWTAEPAEDGYFKLRNSHSGKVLGVENMGTGNGSRVIQWSDNGTDDHLWRLRYGGDGHFRIQCAGGGRVLGVLDRSRTAGAQIVIWDDNGTDDHLWRFV